MRTGSTWTCRLFTALILSISLLSAPTLQAAEFAAGTTLGEALAALRAEHGLRILYSSDVVDEDLRLAERVAAEDPAEALTQLLSRFGLTAEQGEGGVWVVRAPRPEVGGAPPTSAAAIASSLIAPDGRLETVVVHPSQYRVYGPDGEIASSLSRETVDRMPHLGDDMMRALARVPGVAMGDISALPSVRGGRPDEVLVLLDGQPLYQPYHMQNIQSPVSAIDSNVIETTTVYSGAFPARYGGRNSAVIDMDSLMVTEQQHALGLSFMTAFGYTQGLSDDGDTAWLASLRRGYLDLVLSVMDAGGDLDPQYADAFAKIDHQIGSQRLFLNLFAAAHDTVFLDDGDEVNSRGAADSLQGWVGIEGPFLGLADDLHSRTVLAVAEVNTEEDGEATDPNEVVGLIDDDRSLSTFEFRQDFDWRVNPRWSIGFGGEYVDAEADYDTFSTAVFAVPTFQGGQPPYSFTRNADFTLTGHSWAAYLSTRVALSQRLTVDLGVRWAEQGWIAGDERQTDPRAAIAWQVGERSVLRAAWGRHHQPPRLDELQVRDGVNVFYPVERAEHRVLSFEHRMRNGDDLRIELFDKRYSDLWPRFDNVFDPIEVVAELQVDRARIDADSAQVQGLELSVGGQRGRFSWWGSYVYSDAHDVIGGREQPRPWDETHALTFDLGYRTASGWTLDTLLEWHTGWPTTDLRPVGFDPNGVPILDADPLYGLRYEDFFKVSLRAARTRPVGDGSLTYFFELHNATNTGNPCCTDINLVPSADPPGFAVERDEENWLPLMPSFGVTWEF